MTGVVFQGCKSKKEAPAPADEVEIVTYCSGPEYQTNSEYFRANQIGESLDQAVSKKKALSNAKADLAAAIETTMKATFDNYVNSRELNNIEEVEERYEGLSREVVNQKLNGIRTICEKQTKTTSGTYKTYIAIELAGDEIMSAMNQRLPADAKLKIDYDYEKFKQTFNEEMNKMEEQKGY
ncbi:MAG: hypothetical protein KKA81_15585 [Bacteroidetes bacterium]|nr:hypothetical protein [Bacteroidota bacterium]